METITAEEAKKLTQSANDKIKSSEIVEKLASSDLVKIYKSIKSAALAGGNNYTFSRCFDTQTSFTENNIKYFSDIIFTDLTNKGYTGHVSIIYDEHFKCEIFISW